MSEFLSDIQQTEAEAVKIVETARTKAEQMKNEAERKAREIVKNVRNDILKEVEAIRLEAEKAAKEKAKKLTAKAENEVVDLEKLSASNMSKAVDLILSYVFAYGGVEK